MLNVETHVEDGFLHVKVDLSKDHGPSKSGKTTIIGSTQGNQKIATPAGDVTLGLNCYKRRTS
jgi:hypothetical protein